MPKFKYFSSPIHGLFLGRIHDVFPCYNFFSSHSWAIPGYNFCCIPKIKYFPPLIHGLFLGTTHVVFPSSNIFLLQFMAYSWVGFMSNFVALSRIPHAIKFHHFSLFIIGHYLYLKNNLNCFSLSRGFTPLFIFSRLQNIGRDGERKKMYFCCYTYMEAKDRDPSLLIACPRT